MACARRSRSSCPTEEIAGHPRRARPRSPGDLVCIVADRADRANVALDGLRRDLAARLDLIPQGRWEFCWYIEPPLFDWSDEEGRWVANHHPFTAPLTDDLAPETAKARAYDLVLNGFEIGGGQHPDPPPRRPAQRVRGARARRTTEIEEKFGHLIRAFRYGAPPHGGIAMGIDRLVMVLAGKESLRDVTAFPKAQSGADPLTGAPAPVDDAQLRELGLAAPAERRGGMTVAAHEREVAELLRRPTYHAHLATTERGRARRTSTPLWVDADHGRGLVVVNTAVGTPEGAQHPAGPARGRSRAIAAEDPLADGLDHRTVVRAIGRPRRPSRTSTPSTRRYDGERRGAGRGPEARAADPSRASSPSE